MVIPISFNKCRTHDDYQDIQNVIDWLSPINHRITQNDTFSKHTAGTGTWFIEHPKFQKWLSRTIPVLCAIGPREDLTCHYFPVAEHSRQRVSGRLFFRKSSSSSFHSCSSFFSVLFIFFFYLAPSLFTISRAPFRIIDKTSPLSLRTVVIRIEIQYRILLLLSLNNWPNVIQMFSLPSNPSTGST